MKRSFPFFITLITVLALAYTVVATVGCCDAPVPGPDSGVFDAEYTDAGLCGRVGYPCCTRVCYDTAYAACVEGQCVNK